MRNSKNRPSSENGLAETPNSYASPSLNDGDADDSLPEAPADVSLRWGQPHRFAILRADGLSGGAPPPPEAWDAGAINVLATDGPIAIAGARSSGLWLINPEYDALPQTENFPAQSLSYSSENTYTSALEWGPEKPRFLFAALSRLSLIELKVGLGRLEFVDQRRVPLHAHMGAIQGLTFLDGPRVLVAATDKGLWWTSVPLNPQSTSLYKWQRSTDGLSVEEFSCISPIKDGLSVAAAGVTKRGVVHSTVVESGIFCGSWTGNDFTFSKSIMPKSVQINECRITCCAGNRTTAYAVTTDNNNKGIGAVLRSETAGATWELATIPAGHGEQGSYNMCIAAHPSDRQVVVLGWQKGVFVSANKGNSWDLRSAPHSDQHALTFSERAPGEFSLFVASDGGLALSSDLGLSWDSRYNKHLLNLEIYRPHGFESAPFDASTVVEGLIACATQDNGNLWCPIDELVSKTSPPWDAFQKFDGGDGETALLLDDKSAVWVEWDPLKKNLYSESPRSSLFHESFPAFFDTTNRGTIVPVSASQELLRNPVIARPRMSNLERNGERLLAIAAQHDVVYVLWRAPGQLGAFARLANAGAQVTSLASYDGAQILVGTTTGQIFLCETNGGSLVSQPVNQDAGATPIIRILWAAPDVRFALDKAGRILRSNGVDWNLLANGPSRAVHSLEFARELAGGVLFACTDSGVLLSQDRGDTWVRASEGLPRNCKGTNLKIAASEGRTYLYLATYGWGVFRANITPRRSVKIRIPRRELIRKLIPIIEQRMGIEIRDGDIFPTDPAPDAYQLAVATLIHSLSEETFPDRDVEANRLQEASYSLAQKLARQSVT